MPNETIEKFPSQPVESLVVNARKAASMLGVSVRTLWRLRERSALPPSFKLVSRRVWRVEDLKRFVADGFVWENQS